MGKWAQRDKRETHEGRSRHGVCRAPPTVARARARAVAAWVPGIPKERTWPAPQPKEVRRRAGPLPAQRRLWDSLSGPLQEAASVSQLLLRSNLTPLRDGVTGTHRTRPSMPKTGSSCLLGAGIQGTGASQAGTESPLSCVSLVCSQPLWASFASGYNQGPQGRSFQKPLARQPRTEPSLPTDLCL